MSRLGFPPAYYTCARTPNRNGAYGCVYKTRDEKAVLATVVPKPLSVSLQPTRLSYHNAACKVARTSGECKYGG